jgi:hypothetical protein
MEAAGGIEPPWEAYETSEYPLLYAASFGDPTGDRTRTRKIESLVC